MSEQSEKNIHAGHRERLRERYDRSGMDDYADHEVLELLLTYAIPRRDVKPLAKALINRFGTLAAVFDATEYELSAVPGMGGNSTSLILLMKALGSIYLQRKITGFDLLKDSMAVVDFIRMKIGGAPKETMLVLYLNNHNHLLGYHCIPGTVDRATIFRREIMEQCIIHRATGIIIAHNHPSGVCLPSNEDLELTHRIKAAADATDIRFIDHILVTPTSWRSLQAEKLI